MTLDGSDELYKIKAIQSEAELILRIAVDDFSSVNILSGKFGAPLSSVMHLCLAAKTLGLNVVGISFHVGSGATDPHLFTQAIQDAHISFDRCIEAEHFPKILDVGGGFSTESFESMSQPIVSAVEAQFLNNVDVIAEPGRYFEESAFTLRRSFQGHDNTLRSMLYLNDGIYGNFLDLLLSGWNRRPRILSSANELPVDVRTECTIWGRTCCGDDRIVKAAVYDIVFDIGDWLYFEGIGAYSLCSSTSFNGYPSEQIVHHVCSEAVATALLAQNVVT